MLLPNGERAIVEDHKLLRYILNPSHPHGKTHAQLFDRLLGINLTCADVLRQALLDAAKSEQALPGQQSEFGAKFEIRFSLTGRRGTYTVLSIWMLDSPEASPDRKS